MNQSLRATKCVIQQHSSEQLGSLLADCLNVTYNAIHYAKEHGIDNRRGMKGFYQTLKEMKLPSCYKVASITRLRRRPESQEGGEARNQGEPSRTPQTGCMHRIWVLRYDEGTAVRPIET